MAPKEKKSKKSKKEKVSVKVEKVDKSTGGSDDYDKYKARASPISKPYADKKLTKNALKATKNAAKAKCLRRGVKEVVKAVRKGEEGFVLIAGDIFPIDVISHLPVLCEDQGIPFCFVPSKEHLGAAGSTKRPTSCVLVKTHADYADVHKQLSKEIKSLPIEN